MLCFVFCFQRLTRMWATGEEHVRVLAFMCIRKSLTLQPNLFEFVLKVFHNLFNKQFDLKQRFFMEKILIIFYVLQMQLIKKNRKCRKNQFFFSGEISCVLLTSSTLRNVVCLFLENVFWICSKFQICDAKDQAFVSFYAKLFGRNVQFKRNNNLSTCIYLHQTACHTFTKCYNC